MNNDEIQNGAADASGQPSKSEKPKKPLKEKTDKPQKERRSLFAPKEDYDIEDMYYYPPADEQADKVSQPLHNSNASSYYNTSRQPNAGTYDARSTHRHSMFSPATQPYADHLNNPTVSTGLEAIRENLSSKLGGRLPKIISFSLAMLLCLVALIALASPVIRSGMGTFGGVRITPFNFIFTRFDEVYNLFGNLHFPQIAFLAAFGFYIVFAVSLFAIAISTVFVFINKKRDITSRFCDIFMAVIVVFLFVSMLISQNFRNIYAYFMPNVMVQAGGTGAFVIGLLILIAKYVSNIFLKQDKNEEFEKSRLSIATSFVLFVLIIGAMFAPLYILPLDFSFGTGEFALGFRMTGWDLLFNRHDELSHFPAASLFRTTIIIFLFLSLISFVVNFIFYLGSKKVFIQFNKFNILIGITTLVLYTVVGAMYLILSVEGVRTINNLYGWTTYAYFPIALFAMYILGILFVKLASMGKMNIEYKVYAKAGERKRGGGVGDKAKQDEPLEITGYDPIPAFSEIDGMADKFNADYQENMGYLFHGVTLPSLVDHIIEYAKNSSQNLSYGKREIKTFIAGLGASRLTILQGMSGTGKTSLPKIFSEAIGGICEMIAVESSWRDKNELLGYYNEFNKKFTPKAFTQGLYKASLNKDTPVFIVLDEMNLSRIEYYFSDFLSLMEAEESERRIKLFDVQLYPETDEREEYLSLTNGHTLDIPNNIWFIGTANRDESTFEISDKVYDRAQTMNFDKRASKVLGNGGMKENLKRFVNMESLRGLFEQARATAFDAEANDVIRKVEKLLIPYRISFGNRVLKQIEEFVKVYLAASGARNSKERDEFIHEAVDCIVLSKIVRKLEFKQVNNIDELIDSFGDLKLPLCEQFLLGLQN